MKLITILFCWMFMLAFTACEGPVGPEVAGLRLGMSRGQVHAVLQGNGQLEKEPGKQQEVWRLAENNSFSHVMVGYDKEFRSVRFVTALAKSNGRRVAYSDVIDTTKATRADTGNNVAYILQSGEAEEAFLVRAMGTDPQYISYFSVKSLGEGEEEEDE
jgi:hypothetical protein